MTERWMTRARAMRCAIASSRRSWKKSFGVAPGTRLSRFLESLELVKRLWTEDTVDHDGQHFRLNGVGIGIRPLQKPRPPIVLAASADAMVERTARVADGLTLARKR